MERIYLNKLIERYQKTNIEAEKIKQLVFLRSILKLIIIGFFWRSIDSRSKKLLNKKQSLIEKIREEIERESEAIIEIHETVKNSEIYLTHDLKEQHTSRFRNYDESLQLLKKNRILDESFILQEIEKVNRFHQTLLDYNEHFIQKRKADYDYLFKKEEIVLDGEQREAVIKDDLHNLVIAGAGSGKTEILITRIAYLIERQPDKVEPNRILALAYQNKAQHQIVERLQKQYNLQDIDVKTFHKLGKDILEEAYGRKIGNIDILDENKKKEIIRGIYQTNLADPNYYEMLLQYLNVFFDIKDEEKHQYDMFEYLIESPYISLNRKKVKSKAERDILNFFLTHTLNDDSIRIDYEPVVNDFIPDFQLPNFDLYIEHWALNKDGEVPSWFQQTSEDYRRNMERKKKWFKERNKLLVETYAYEYDIDKPEGFLELLRNRVIDKLELKYGKDYQFKDKTYDEILETVWRPQEDPIINQIMNFITNAKIYGKTPKTIEEDLLGNWSKKQLTFARLANKIYYDYEDYLAKEMRIDFEDMINRAILELDKKKDLYSKRYDHILIDEYQDISAQRFRLIKSLLDTNPGCRLFCVGDDWQSIMGFAGSNLKFFVNFEKYFESPEITRVSTNYRSIKTIVNAGAELIKNNGENQISKVTEAFRQDTKPIKVLDILHKSDYRSQYYQQMAEDCLNRIESYLLNDYRPEDILVLCRFNAKRIFPWFYENFKGFAKQRGISIAYENEFADRNQIRMMTVHKSKGKEARVVFLLNCIQDTYGFPCKIEDPSIYEPVRDDFPSVSNKEEERRLFYVTITRAREDLIIYTWDEHKSEFLDEIRNYTEEEPLRY
ncbi:MAG: helicase [Thermoproteota archaeon]|nr:helicase [Thermoproteota archaeon]